MNRMLQAGLTSVAILAAGGPAHATGICGWIVEYVDKEEFHNFDLYLQADGEADVYYMMKGQGVTREGSRSYSPGTGSYSLPKGEARRVWGFGTDVSPGDDIDIIAEVHTQPADIFDDTKEPPLLASFTFKRHVPDDEKAIPKTFATKQCATVTLPPSKAR